jgi:ATPase subunit of ABC transporter with duplicated ATPase domains
MLMLHNISYLHPNKDLLFENVNLTARLGDKAALIGNNGVGKSTLLKIISGKVKTNMGMLGLAAKPYYVPQIFESYNHLSVAGALQIEGKLSALKEILGGNVTEVNYAVLDDDWTIEERCLAALRYWQLDVDPMQAMGNLSGGQKTKVFLAGIAIHQPELILLDEPTNHLDGPGRQLLYELITSTKSTVVVVSHDRTLLNLVDIIAELTKEGINAYGGNYELYAEQKGIERNALDQHIQAAEKALRKAREKERETIERQHRLDSRGKGKQEKAGVARIMMNTLRNKAENSTSKLKGVHEEKISGISKELQDLRSALPDMDKMKFGLDHSTLHKGKTLFAAREINYSYGEKALWPENLSFEIYSSDRIAVQGLNGAGKTTLIQLVLGNLTPSTGAVVRADYKSVYIDQEYALLNSGLTVYEQAQQSNTAGLQEHELKSRLNRFLFTKEDWDKPCALLSGGQRMRLMICCLTVYNQSPDIIILDEPTNNLDLQNIEILTAAISQYKGTLLVVSHDEYFLNAIGIEKGIVLEK